MSTEYFGTKRCFQAGFLYLLTLSYLLIVSEAAVPTFASYKGNVLYNLCVIANTKHTPERLH